MQLPTSPGVYAIECTGNDRIYIGSGKNIRNRQTNHLLRLRKKQHFNRKLQWAYNKYGPETFHFYIIELVDATRIAVEQYWVTALDAVKHGFNCSTTVETPTLGMKWSAKRRAEMSAYRRGRPIHSADHKAELSKRWSGKNNPSFGKFTSPYRHDPEKQRAHWRKWYWDHREQILAKERLKQQKEREECATCE